MRVVPGSLLADRAAPHHCSDTLTSFWAATGGTVASRVPASAQAAMADLVGQVRMVLMMPSFRRGHSRASMEKVSAR